MARARITAPSSPGHRAVASSAEVEHLRGQVAALEALLVNKGIVTTDEVEQTRPGRTEKPRA